ncbi:hypothetical protein [Longispora albida]|uniref:hypothetical protein n=1 Tax=Longispora albida TaxID=203523 RepID=UPI00039C2766|nr:hypothetical protein [Longispora albida]
MTDDLRNLMRDTTSTLPPSTVHLDTIMDSEDRKLRTRRILTGTGALAAVTAIALTIPALLPASGTPTAPLGAPPTATTPAEPTPPPKPARTAAQLTTTASTQAAELLPGATFTATPGTGATGLGPWQFTPSQASTFKAWATITDPQGTSHAFIAITGPETPPPGKPCTRSASNVTITWQCTWTTLTDGTTLVEETEPTGPHGAITYVVVAYKPDATFRVTATNYTQTGKNTEPAAQRPTPAITHPIGRALALAL